MYQERQSLNACTVQTWRWAIEAKLRRDHADLARAPVLKVSYSAIVICPQLEAQWPQGYLLPKLQLVGEFRAPSHYQLGMVQALNNHSSFLIIRPLQDRRGPHTNLLARLPTRKHSPQLCCPLGLSALKTHHESFGLPFNSFRYHPAVTDALCCVQG